MMAAEGAPVREQEAVVDESHPWPGLVPFRETHSRFFFGRGLEQEELLRLIRRGVTTLLFGESGLGKTSLLQAGLFPRLREIGYLPVLVRLDYAAEAKPLVEQVKVRLDEAIAAAGLDASRRIEPDETLWEYFHRRELTLVDRKGDPIIPVIVFDQFEELFTLGFNQRKADCQTFIGELSDLMENRPPAAVKASLERSPDRIARYVFKRDDYRIVITLREDFLPALEVFRASAPTLGRNRFRLTRMKGPQALTAVIEPGHGIVSEDVARRIVSLVGGGPSGEIGPEAIKDIEVESSLLSLFCSELNERRLKSGQPTITAELVELSRRDILRSFYERALGGRPLAVREFIEDQLVTDSGARDSIARERADRLLAEKGVPASVIDDLVRDRLLHIEERPGGPRVELIHDVLLDIVRQDKTERAGIALRQALARARKRYLIRAAAVVAVVVILAGSITGVAVRTAHVLDAQNRKLDEQNRLLAEQSTKLSAQNQLLDQQNSKLDEQNQQLIAYRDKLRESLESLMPVLSKFVERSDAQSLGGEKFIDEKVRPAINNIIALADEMRGPGYDSRFMSVKALSLVILAKVATADERVKYVDEATQISVDLLRQGKNYGDISKGYDAFDAITQVWETRDSDRALKSVRQSISILEQIDTTVIDTDERNGFVGSAILREAGILQKASRFDEAAQSLRGGVNLLSASEKALPLAVLIDLYNNLGDVLLTARDRTTDEAAKKSAIDSAIAEYEHAWDKVVVYFKLQDSVSLRNWMARHARKIAGLYETLRNVERARLFYTYELRVRRSLVPDEDKATATYDVDAAKRDVAAALGDIGYLERNQGDKSKAIDYYTECVRNMEALVSKNAAGANQQSLDYCYTGLADTLLDDHKRPEAFATYQKALTIQEALVKAEPTDVDRQNSLAYIYGQLGDAYLNDGKRSEAFVYCQKALPIREKLSALEPNNADRQVNLAFIYRVCGDSLLYSKRTAALAYYQQALAIRERLVAAEPGNVDRQGSLAYVYGQLADAILADNRGEAISYYEQSLAIRDKLAAAEPDNAERQNNLAWVYGQLADALLADGKRADALTDCQKALPIREKLAAAEPDNTERQNNLAFIYRVCADILQADKRLEALGYYDKAIAIREKMVAAEPDNADRQSSLAYVYGQLADALQTDGRHAEAFAVCQKGVPIREKLAAAEPKNTDRQSDLAFMYRVCADALQSDKKPDAARGYYDKAIAIREKLVAAEPNNAERQSSLAYVYGQLADALVTGGKHVEAWAICQKAIPIREKLAAAAPNNADRQSDLAFIYRVAADALLADGKRPEAIGYYEQVLTIRQKLADAEPNSTDRQGSVAYAYRNLANALLANGKLTEAIADFQNVVTIRETLAQAEPDNTERQTDLGYAYEALARALLADGQVGESLAYRRKALAVRERGAARTEQAEVAAKGKPGADTASELGNLAWDAILAQLFDRALAASERAIGLAPDEVWIETNRAHALMFLGRTDDARSVYLRYLGVKNVQSGKPWEVVILDDFTALRRAGLSNPLMNEIEKRFTAGQ